MEQFTPDNVVESQDRFDDTRLDGFELSIANIREAGNTFVIKKAVRDLEKGSLTVDQTKALFSRAVEEREMSRYDNLKYPDDDSVYDPKIKTLNFSRQDEQNPIQTGNPVFPFGIREFDFDSGALIGMESVALKAFETSSPEDQVEIAKHILNIYSYMDHEAISFALIDQFEISGRAKDIFNLCADKIWNERNKYHYRLVENSQYRTDDLMQDLADNANSEWVPEYLIGMANDNDKRKMLGMCVDALSFPRVVNSIRDYIKKTGDLRATRIGRMLIGVDPDDDSKPFHVQLSDVYRSVKFENYPSNLETNEFELRMIREIPTNNSADGITLDLACGTGRIANGLAGTVQNIVGIDNSHVNLEKAREADKTKTVDYREADIANTGLEQESVKRGLFIGRSSTHAEDELTYDDWLSEIERITMEGGTFLVDFPDSNTGEILEKRKVYIKTLQNLDIPITMTQGLKSFSYLIDSPDGANLYNRWVPQIQRVIQLFDNHGFDAKIYERKRIEARGEVNVYILATKIK